ncbi:hypothetical protein GCM10007905_10530 [Mixta theicola]|nr:hypothetical protein GCM10007905_10530 [Mixta theicola]
MQADFFKEFAVHGLFRRFSGINPALRKLPGVLSETPGPQYLSLSVTNYNTNIWAVAIIVDHGTTSN